MDKNERDKECRLAMSRDMEEFAMDIKERFKAIMIREPRGMKELCKELGVSRDLAYGFMTGVRKTSFKSLYKIEGWIRKEEERLGIK